jgi:hypothetical protein
VSRASYDLAKKLSVILDDLGIDIPERAQFQHRFADWLDELKEWLKL